MSKKFSISKWYMDCIDDEGNTFIGYSAFLQWGKLKFNFSSQILYTNDLGYKEKTSFLKVNSPNFENNLLNWDINKPMHFGEWKNEDDSFEEQLLKSDKGNIDWYCAQPKAVAEINTLKNTQIKGLGYTEKLILSIKPWALPIDQLRWGRFLSKTHTLIWIQWIGPKPKNLLYINGEIANCPIINDFKIEAPNNHLVLQLSESVTLRKGSLIKTVFQKFPWMKKIFPDKILSTFECKWRSKGTLFINNKKISSGWSIHEIVSWK